MVEIIDWDVEQIFKHRHLLKNYAVLVLNRPLRLHPKFFISLWNKAKIRITVDGGTDRWYTYKNGLKEPFDSVAPIDIVCGDFDSVTNSTLKIAKDENIEIIHLEDQDETDFTKSLRILNEKNVLKDLRIESAFVICETSGRIDQILANINTLYKCSKKPFFNMNMRVYLVSNNSISWLLKSGNHRIKVPSSVIDAKNAWCALVPIGEKCTNTTTTGLKWNLQNNNLEFGHLVSTSNTYNGCDEITITNNAPLLWSMDILPILNDIYNAECEED